MLNKTVVYICLVLLISLALSPYVANIAQVYVWLLPPPPARPPRGLPGRAGGDPARGNRSSSMA